MDSESPSSKKEPPWRSILPQMPRISVSTNSRARLSHRRPVLLSSATPLPHPPPPSPPPAAAAPAPVAVLTQPPPSPLSPKSTNKSSESPRLETLPAPAPRPPSSVSPARTAAPVAGPWPACSSSAGLHSGDSAGCLDAASRPGNVCSLSNVDPSGNLSSVCAASELVTPNSEEYLSANGSHSPVSFAIARISSPFALQHPSSPEGGYPGVHRNGVGFGMDSVDGLNEANDRDIGGLSRDRCTSSNMKFTVAETTSSAGCRGGLEDVDEYERAGIRLNREKFLNVCCEAETSDLVRSEEIVLDEGELEEGQSLGGGGNEAKDSDFGRSSKGCCTSSDMEITIAEPRSSPSCHNALEEVDGCKGFCVPVNYENCSHIGREAEISDLVNKEELVLNEGELEEGQLPGEWSGSEVSDEDSEPAQMLEDSAAVRPVVREVSTIPLIENVENQIYYPFQAEGIHSEQRSGGNTKAKGKKKKKHKKGEGSKKRSREKSKEKHNEVLKKRMAQRKGLDGGSNSDGLRNSKDSSGRGDQTGNNNGTGKFNEVPKNVSQTLPKKPTVDEGPEDGEILLESTKTKDGILSSLVEAEVGLWTTDDVDDQFVAEMEQDGAVKRKRGPETAERKLKRKIAKRKKRAQKERELGIRRPSRMAQSKPVKVLCTHYMKGRCAKGDQCTFSHDAVPLTKQEPCKFLMSHSCLKGDDCPYSHDLRAFPCKFFHTRGLCYDGENCQFSHGNDMRKPVQEKKGGEGNNTSFLVAISEEALAKLKQRVEKEKKERISSTSALDVPTPFSTPLPPELDPDPLGWGTPTLYPKHEEQMQYTNPTILDQSTRLSGDINLENHGSGPPAKVMMPTQSIGFSTSTDRKDAEFDAASPRRIGEAADEYKYVQFGNTKALQSEKSIDVRKFKSEGESSVPGGLTSTEGPYPSTMPKFLKAPVCSENSNAKEVLEVPRMEGRMDPAQSLGGESLTSSNESGPQVSVSGLPSLVSPLLARTVTPILRGRQLGRLVLEHEKVLQSPLRTEPRRQHTVDSLLDEALRQ